MRAKRKTARHASQSPIAQSNIRHRSATRNNTERKQDTPARFKGPSLHRAARPPANCETPLSTISKARRRSLLSALSSGGVDFAEFGVLKEWGDYSDRILLDFDERHTRFVRGIWAVCRIIGVRPLVLRLDRTRRGW